MNCKDLSQFLITIICNPDNQRVVNDGRAGTAYSKPSRRTVLTKFIKGGMVGTTRTVRSEKPR